MEHTCSWEGCGKTFKKECRLKQHMRQHTGERPFTCPREGCGKTYTRQEHLNLHLKTHDGLRNHKCTFEGCTQAFYTPHKLRKHLLTHEKELPYKCTHEGCEAAFRKHNQLRKHESIHTGHLPHRCEFEGCKAEFMTASQLSRHARIHTQGFHCAECPARFCRWLELVQHRRTAHPVAHVCEVCGRAFASGDQLRQHKHLHDPTRPQFICSVPGCQKQYSTAYNLKAHQRAVHHILTPDAEIFECTTCGARFNYKCSLRNHESRGSCQERLQRMARKKAANIIARVTGMDEEDREGHDGSMEEGELEEEGELGALVEIPQDSGHVEDEEDEEALLLANNGYDGQFAVAIHGLFDGLNNGASSGARRHSIGRREDSRTGYRNGSAEEEGEEEQANAYARHDDEEDDDEDGDDEGEEEGAEGAGSFSVNFGRAGGTNRRAGEVADDGSLQSQHKRARLSSLSQVTGLGLVALSGSYLLTAPPSSGSESSSDVPLLSRQLERCSPRPDAAAHDVEAAAPITPA